MAQASQASQEGEKGQEAKQGDGSSGPRNARGWTILYVGGRTKMVPHLRRVAKRYSGRLLHHDGGLHDGLERLSGCVEKADAILCPVDCVSHDAVGRIKKACERCRKPFVPLRGHGTSAFARGLGALCSDGEEA